MTSRAEARIAQLTQGMLRKKLYVVLSKGAASPDRIQDVLPLHLEYMIDLERQGLVFASGPLASEEGMRGDGMTILRTTSVEETRRIAAADPFVAQGLRTFEVREWTVMEGSLALKVNFSDRSVEVS
ncbi:MAG: YciI family protein [Xanthobacteraceae bacterium]